MKIWDWIQPRAVPIAFVVLLLLITGLSLWAMSAESATFDEGAHLAAGYTYVMAGDFRLMAEHPPLPKIWQALPLLFMDVKIPPAPDEWRRGDVWAFAYHLLYRWGNDPDALLSAGRLASLFWGLLLVSSVFALGRELFGERAGLAAAGLLGLCPVFLAHAHLVTLESCTVALGFLSVVAFRRFCRTPRPLSAIATGILLGGALASKHSSIYLVIVFPLLAWGAVEHVDRRRAWLLGPLVPFVAWVTLWGLYGFRYSGGTVPFGWGASTGPLIAVARDWKLFPEAYLSGIVFVRESVATRDAFLLGHFSRTGWALYFPVAFAVTTPFATLLLTFWGAVGRSIRAWKERAPFDLLLLPTLVYGGFALVANLNIGIRHLLPIYPFLMVMAGSLPPFAAAGESSPLQRRVASGLLIVSLLSGIAAAPLFLGDFNIPSRLLGAPEEILADSNVDWGQDLARLKRFMDERGVTEIHLAYFGTSSPRDLGLRHRRLPVSPIHTHYPRYEPEWPQSEELKPGDWVAISSTYLSGAYLEDRAYYRRLVPRLHFEARVGRSMLVYRFPFSGKP